MNGAFSLESLQGEINQIRRRLQNLKDDSAFVY